MKWVSKILVLVGIVGSVALLIVGGRFEEAKRAFLRLRIRKRGDELRESGSIVDEQVKQEFETRKLIEEELDKLQVQKHQLEDELKGLSNEDVVSELNRRGF